MKQFWITFFGSVVGVIVGSVLAVILLIFMIGALIGSAMQNVEAEAPGLPDEPMILELDLREPRIDQPSRSPFAYAEPLAITEIVMTLQRAADDDRVAGVFVRANEFGMSPGQAEELRAAFARFSESGKFVLAHAQGFEATTVTNYFAVGGVDELWLQDTANFAATGLAVETPFLGGLFEQFDAVPQFLQFHEYKNAANTYTESDYTEAHREATLSYLGSILDSAVAGLADDRGMDAETLTTLIETGPRSAEQALEAGLIDRLGHVVAAREAARERAGDESASFVEIERYARAAPRGGRGSGPVVALVGGQGPIVTGDGDGGFGGGEMIGGDRMAQAIQNAVDDDSVRAIILRVDSPGGSAIASDQVWDAVIRAREAGKPVIVSMASVAASGGYYISAPADLIVANATTITGSIGMLAGKIVIDGTLDNVGMNIEPLHVGGDYTLAWSAQQEWTEAQREAFYTLAEDVYEDFTERVADGRDLPLERVQEIARGRVWTGAQAHELGLVDRIGGLYEAVEAAREIAGIDPDEAIRVRAFPSRPTPLEAFRELFGVTAESAEAAARLNALMQTPGVREAIRMREQAARPGVSLYAGEEQPR
ncbi:signal peptide peptidase SppA [Marinicauda salina]|uniref:Signal peptide peptidase SppA n=1 Tax=Marinicauda salina TaxID=2135793 RepID=A0A2U2BSK8_9PROT|nr:signal peptide peptidase SppA [Marinicauda salina]PWE16982.1 signal peptide peptidase SppA [Marinicauda salina]